MKILIDQKLKNKRETSGRKGILMRSKRLLRAFVGAVVVLTLGAMMLFSFGCSKMLPTAPTEDPVEGFRAEELWPAPPANLANLQRDCSARSSERIGPSGGVLSLQGDCFELDFVVPSGALTEVARISVAAAVFQYWCDGNVERGIGFVFKPDGLVFLEPAEIELEAVLLGAKKGDVLKLYWYNPKTGLWEVEQEVKVDDAQVELEFEIHHFSRYAIS